MPTYEYLCRSCGERLEVVQSFSDAALTTCGACGGELRKVFSAAGLIFKGSGWHVKDYASSGTGSSAAGTGTAASSGDTSVKGSSDAGGASDGASSKGAEAASSKPAAASTPAPAASSTGD
jgi:putative FmdB family regulatory protein